MVKKFTKKIKKIKKIIEKYLTLLYRVLYYNYITKGGYTMNKTNANEKKKLKTRKGYDFFIISSAMQKAIRRGDARVAGFCALELYHSGYHKYVWKRLLTISAEDCYGVITKEIWALYQSFNLVNEGKKDFSKGRIFISKAILILSQVAKNRDSDHLQNFIYDGEMVSEDEIREYADEIGEIDKIEIPEYAYDCHTMEGRKKGKTKKDFFTEEFEALKNRQLGLFDNLVYGVK